MDIQSMKVQKQFAKPEVTEKAAAFRAFVLQKLCAVFADSTAMPAAPL